MHETEAVRLIRPVLDFFINREFKGIPTEDEFEMALGCFQDFVKDQEPYWVVTKAEWIIVHLLDFKNKIGDCPATLKEAVLLIVKTIRTNLGKIVEKEVNDSHSITLTRDIAWPRFMALHRWSRLNWNYSQRPDLYDN
jgi:uncharacterized membrane protein